jgi:hypothetical protein
MPHHCSYCCCRRDPVVSCANPSLLWLLACCTAQLPQLLGTSTWPTTAPSTRTPTPRCTACMARVRLGSCITRCGRKARAFEVVGAPVHPWHHSCGSIAHSGSPAALPNHSHTGLRRRRPPHGQPRACQRTHRPAAALRRWVQHTARVGAADAPFGCEPATYHQVAKTCRMRVFVTAGCQVCA